MSRRGSRSIITIMILAALCAGTFCSCNGAQNNTASESNVSSLSDKVSEKSEASKEKEPSFPEIKDPTPESSGEIVNDILIYNGTAYEPFYGGKTEAKKYADTVSYVKKSLGDKINVYNVIVPTHIGVDLPDKFADKYSSQKDYLNNIVDSYSEKVIGVNAYNSILSHRNEYLYFHSDHHWTVLGAYYAYQEFAKKAGVEPVKLKDLDKDKIEGYVGSFTEFTGRNDFTPDYVEYYSPKNFVDCTKYDKTGNNPSDHLLIHYYAEGRNAYGVFLGGDEPLLVTKNEKGNGKKIAVLKESYGNAFSPFIAYTYSEAHLIDFRSIEFNLKDYLDKNGITDVIIINNAMASATKDRNDELKAVVDSSRKYEPVESSSDSEERNTDEPEDAVEDVAENTAIDDTGEVSEEVVEYNSDEQ